MTSIASRFAVLLSLFAAFALTACGSSPAPYVPVPTTYCVGPEKINDLGDLLHREMVRYPDAYCAAGALPQGFAIVAAPDYVSMPDIGEDVALDAAWGYHRTRVYRSVTVVHVINPVSPPRTSVLLVRDPTVGSSQVRATAASRAQLARKNGVSGVASGTQAGPSGASTVTRGGLGSKTAAADKKDPASVARQSAGVAAAQKAGAAKAASVSSSSRTSSSTSSVSRSSSSRTGR